MKGGNPIEISTTSGLETFPDDNSSIDSSDLESESSIERDSVIDIEEEEKMEMDAHGSWICKKMANMMPAALACRDQKLILPMKLGPTIKSE